MSQTAGKAVHLLKDIWVAYAESLLKKNPGWWSRYKNKISHHSVGYYDEKGKMIEVINYPKYRKTIEYFFDRAKQEIIQGNCINLTSHVGKICVIRVQRDFRKAKQRKIDWGRTKKYPKVFSPEKGKDVYQNIVYFTSEDWCRIAWIKSTGLANQQVYEFSPSSRNSAGTTGFKFEFSQAQKEDKLLQYRYLYRPILANKIKKEDLQL
jgi:hypothetical protein